MTGGKPHVDHVCVGRPGWDEHGAYHLPCARAWTRVVCVCKRGAERDCTYAADDADSEQGFMSAAREAVTLRAIRLAMTQGTLTSQPALGVVTSLPTLHRVLQVRFKTQRHLCLCPGIILGIRASCHHVTNTNTATLQQGTNGQTRCCDEEGQWEVLGGG
jgi:hypothetical protein